MYLLMSESLPIVGFAASGRLGVAGRVDALMVSKLGPDFTPVVGAKRLP